MQKLLLSGVLLVFSAAAIAQTSAATQSSSTVTNQASQSVISSNGPVVLDYGKRLPATSDATETKIAEQVRHQLLKLPLTYYGMFDDLEYSVQGRTVTLSGFVTAEHSGTKQDAAKAIKRIEGVDQVVNNVRVLPAYPFDDQAREHVLHALMSTGPLAQYFWPISPDIRIIVDNQRLTLKGYVHSEAEKNMATVVANQVRDLFQVTNDLQVVR